MAQSETLTGCARRCWPRSLGDSATPLSAVGEGGFVAAKGLVESGLDVPCSPRRIRLNATSPPTAWVGQPERLYWNFLQCHASNVYSNAVQTADVDEKDRRA
jgi:hypothetical protein